MRKTILAILLALLAACTPQQPTGEAVKAEFDRSGQIMQVQVVVHPNLESVNYALDQFYKQDQPEVYGWSAWSLQGKPHQCQIHVAPPETVDDEMMRTWGHELAHCVYGTYHN